MSKNILDYVMESPENTNPAVLGSLLDKENVQADWNQNDESARSYIRNRPFYTGNPVETVLVEEQTVAFSNTDGVYAVQGWPTEFDAVVGETYKVSWDGTEYECECLSMKSLPYIGNLAVAGAEIDTGEPFIFMNQGAWVVGTTSTEAEHLISVSSIVHSVTKIDEKYLPESSFTNAEWSNISNKIVDYKQQSLSLSASGEPITIGAGSWYSDNRINDNLKFEDGMAYEINGNITLYNTESKDSSTLDVNGSYICSNGYVVLGSCYDIYFRKYIEVELHSSSPDGGFHYGKLGAGAAISTTEYTFDINITVTAEARQLPGS